MQPIDGKRIAQEIRARIKKDIMNQNIRPGLAAILVGDNEASKLYVSLKEKACLEAGIYFEKHIYPETIEEGEIINTISALNSRADINGILIQMPLPKRFDADKIIQSIVTTKDVDGFHPQNTQAFLEGRSSLLSPLIQGIERLLEEIHFEYQDKNIYFLAKEGIFSELLKKFFIDRGASVLMGHKDDTLYVKKADVIVLALGDPEFFSAENVKEGVVIIDIGISKNAQGKTVGDFNSAGTEEGAGYFTPVPGGVGPMTVAMLLENVLRLFGQQRI